MLNVASDLNRNGFLVEGWTPNPLQVVWEIEQAVRLCAARKPRRILEIGAYVGGTLKLWCEAATPALAMVVDKDPPPGVDYWALAPKGTQVRVIQRDSRDAVVVETVRQAGPFDWVFIDGDHDYDCVLSDWENYGPQAAPGGVVLFHDIDERNGYGVHRVWRAIQAQGYATQELMAEGPVHCGIGVVYL